MATNDTIDPMQTDMAPITSVDDEFESVKAGRLRPYQVKDTASRRKAYEWWMGQRQVAPTFPGSASVVPQASATDMVDSASTTKLMQSNGEVGMFVDKNAPIDVENVRQGMIRPDQIQNPTVRGAVMNRIQNDPAFASEFRRNIRAQAFGEGIPADPNDVARAEDELRRGVGVPVPEYDRDALIRQKIERKRTEWSESRTARAARQIARRDPRTWDEEIEKFNRRHAGESFLRREDIVSEGGRRQETRSFGRYGDAPQIIQPNPMTGRSGAPRGTSSDPNVIQTAVGDHRIQSVGGRQFAVPVIVNDRGVAIPNAGMLSRGEFDDVIGTRDAAEIKRMIYASGQPEWVSQMRKIDSGYAALDSDTLSPQEREAAEIEIRNRENDLFYRWTRTNGAAMIGGEQGIQRGEPGMQEYESPEDRKERVKAEAAAEKDREYEDRRSIEERRKIIGRATQIKGDNPDMTDEDAIKAAEEEFSGNPSRLYPSRPEPKEPKEERPDFNANRFATEYIERKRRKAAANEDIKKERNYATMSPDVQKMLKERYGILEDADIAKQAFTEAFTEAGGEMADLAKARTNSEREFTKIAERYAAGEITDAELYQTVRQSILRNLPAHLGRFDTMEDDPAPNAKTLRRFVNVVVSQIKARKEVAP